MAIQTHDIDARCSATEQRNSNLRSLTLPWVGGWEARVRALRALWGARTLRSADVVLTITYDSRRAIAGMTGVVADAMALLRAAHVLHEHANGVVTVQPAAIGATVRVEALVIPALPRCLRCGEPFAAADPMQKEMVVCPACTVAFRREQQQRADRARRAGA